MAVDFPAGCSQPLEGRETLRLGVIERARPAGGAESKARLEKRLLGRQVDCCRTPYQEVGKPVNVMVYRKGEYNINENQEQLEKAGRGPPHRPGGLRRRLVAQVAATSGRNRERRPRTGGFGGESGGRGR